MSDYYNEGSGTGYGASSSSSLHQHQAQGNSSPDWTMPNHFGQMPSAPSRMHSTAAGMFSHHAGNTQMHDSSNIALNSVRLATAETLFAAQNQAYMRIYEENMRLSAEIKAQQSFIEFLKTSSSNGFQSLPNISSNAGSSSSLHNPASSNPASSNPASSNFAEDLPNSTQPPRYRQDDYPHTRYWTKSDYKEVKRLCNEKGTGLYALAFLVDEQGRPLSALELKEIWEYFKMLCNTLYRHRQNPKSWKVKTHTAGTYIRNMMCAKFNTFCLGENFWKLEEYATLKFPDWVAHTEKSGTLQRKNPSINTSSHAQTKSSKKRRAQDTAEPEVKVKRERREPRVSVRDPTDVIEIESGSEADIAKLATKKQVSSSSADRVPISKESSQPTPALAAAAAAATHTSLSLSDVTLATMLQPPPAPATHQSPSSHSDSLPSDSLPQSPAKSSPSYVLVSSDTALSEPSSPSIELQPSAVVTESSQGPIAGRSSMNETTQPLLTGLGPIYTGTNIHISSPTAARRLADPPALERSEAVSITGGIDTSSQSQGASSRGSRRLKDRDMNLLSSISVPPPPAEHISPLSENPSASTSTALPKEQKSKKNGSKPFKIGTAITLRNVFAAALMDSLPPNTILLSDEFQEALDKLTKEEKDKYETLVREKKNSAKSTK